MSLTAPRLTAPRLAAAVLGVSLAAGLGALPAHAAPTASATPSTSALSVAWDEPEAPEEAFPELVMRVVDRHGEEVELSGPLWSLLGFGGEEEWNDGDVEDAWPELTDEEDARLEEIFALWEQDLNAPLTVEQDALLAKAGLDNPWAELTDEEIEALEEIWALLDEDPKADLTAEQQALLEKTGWDDAWPELTDEEELRLEEIFALWEQDPEAELTAEQQALLEKIGWSSEPVDPAEYLTDDQLDALRAYGDTTCVYVGDTFVTTLAGLFSSDADAWDGSLDEAADAVLVVGRTPCAEMTPAELAVQEDLRIEVLLDGELESVTRVLVTDPALLAEAGLDGHGTALAEDPSEAPVPVEDRHLTPEIVQTGGGAQWWVLAGAALAAGVLVRARRLFSIR